MFPAVGELMGEDKLPSTFLVLGNRFLHVYEGFGDDTESMLEGGERIEGVRTIIRNDVHEMGCGGSISSGVIQDDCYQRERTRVKFEDQFHGIVL